LQQSEMVLDQAEKTLLSANLVERAFSHATDMGATGQAFSDFNMSALNIVYALSGKQTAVAEMERFLNAYGPKRWDGAERIKLKAARVRGMLNALKEEAASGEIDENSIIRAGAQNPGISDEPPSGGDDRQRLQQKYGLE
jgi:hypothetical protein